VVATPLARRQQRSQCGRAVDHQPTAGLTSSRPQELVRALQGDQGHSRHRLWPRTARGGIELGRASGGRQQTPSSPQQAKIGRLWWRDVEHKEKAAEPPCVPKAALGHRPRRHNKASELSPRVRNVSPRRTFLCQCHMVRFSFNAEKICSIDRECPHQPRCFVR
jgi:hypothetical protein